MPLVNGSLRFGISDEGPNRFKNLHIGPLRGSLSAESGTKELNDALRTRFAPSSMFMADWGFITKSAEDRGLRVCMK